ncbi:MAG: hypothetical protein RLZZ187_153 [Pseudomonadota bacterium]|jgi:hypothetical protein
MRRAVLLIAVLLPAACAQPASQDGDAALQGALASHQASLGAITGQTGAAARAIPSGPVPAQANQLVGQTPEAVLHWLGPPRLRRAEGSAEIWHYQASQCHLDLVLYPEPGVQPGLRVAFAAARAIGAARRAEAACLRDIARGAAAPTQAPGPARPAGAAQAG